ncbi:3'-5' exonuclease [Pseudomonas avellanae]|uniref:3'-5' exonuclease n=1 Tax=Pseudomonas avellanae TaxID=46257 RepID=UPI0006202BC1|nr:3'-5' exonuclease [Pseudomonas avellanae]UQW77113.1 UvrD-helicase domain-containing protein [Pseudomonas avellanae]
MEFRIADTFTTSLARLNGGEQKAVKTSAFDLQIDPSGNGMSFHKLDGAKDPNFWSVRVSRDLRLIVHKTKGSLLLCYVDHHDRAYSWAERRKLEVHPTTGAAQLVEIRERVEEVLVSKYVTDNKLNGLNKPKLFEKFSEANLLAYGVPQEWLADVKAADEHSLLELAAHLPSEAAEALLELATGGTPALPEVADKGTDPFHHPDAQRRFRVMSDMDELARALEYPWDKWTVFLHPAQRQLVDRKYNGAARVSGSAGTGKTVVALHRAVYLASNDEDARVLLSTLSDTLANALRGNLYRLIWNTPKLGERIDVAAMEAIGLRLYSAELGKPTFASRDEISLLLKAAAAQVEGLKANAAFLMSEWDDVVDTWQVNAWEGYRDAKRLGRKTRLPETQRVLYWKVFGKVKLQLKHAGKITTAEMFAHLAEVIPKRKHPVFDYIVVDEAQDISVQQLRFLAAITGNRPDTLFFAGDLGQRIFQTPFSWKHLGVDVRGRSRTLNINYRTSHQIRSQADRLLGPDVSDVDGNVESRNGTISVFNGPEPAICSYADAEAESQAVGVWLKRCYDSGVLPQEIGVFVRSESELSRAEAAVKAAGLRGRVLGKEMATEEHFVSITTMHLAKGMEFRVVAVMACDDEIIPLQVRVDTAADESELTEIYNTERQLLYVACTRARDQLHVSAVQPESEFLQDLMQKQPARS